MRLERLYQYSIYVEFEDNKNYAAYEIISSKGPLERGWTLVFDALLESGNLEDVRKMQNCYCREVQYLIL